MPEYLLMVSIKTKLGGKTTNYIHWRIPN